MEADTNRPTIKTLNSRPTNI